MDIATLPFVSRHQYRISTEEIPWKRHGLEKRWRLVFFFFLSIDTDDGRWRESRVGEREREREGERKKVERSASNGFEGIGKIRLSRLVRYEVTAAHIYTRWKFASRKRARNDTRSKRFRARPQARNHTDTRKRDQHLLDTRSRSCTDTFSPLIDRYNRSETYLGTNSPKSIDN